MKSHWQAEVWRIERTDISFWLGWNHNTDNVRVQRPCSINILKVTSLNFGYHIDNEVNCNFSQDYVKDWMKYWKFSINPKNLLIFSHICKTSILPNYSLLILFATFMSCFAFFPPNGEYFLASRFWAHHKVHFGL